MRPTLFVTRGVPVGDHVRVQLEAEGYTVRGHSLLRFEPREPPALPSVDWVFAYSPRGVRHLPDGHVRAIAERGIRVAGMGTGTAQAWRARGCAVDFVGTADPATTAEAFAKTLAPPIGDAGARPRVGFVQAANSLRSVERLLGDRVTAEALVTYASAIDAAAKVPAADVYWVTSPLNAEAVVARTPSRRSATWWAVGTTTAARLRDLLGDATAVRIRPLPASPRARREEPG